MLIDIRNQQQKQLVPCLACGQARWFRPWVGYRDANYAVEVYRCSTCGLGQLLPPPIQEKLDQFYDADYGAYQCNETDRDRNLDALRFLKRWVGTPRGPTFLAWLKLAGSGMGCWTKYSSEIWIDVDVGSAVQSARLWLRSSH